MQLKPKERGAILAGRFPELVRPEKPEIGQEIVLKAMRVPGGSVPEVSIRVLSASRVKTGGWRIEYSVKDDRGLYPAQGLGYTRSPIRALDRDAPILDPAVIEAYAQEATQSTALLQAEHHAEQKTGKAEARAGKGIQAQEAAIRQQKRNGRNSR